MKFGLNKSELEQIYQIFRSIPEIEQVLIFGSRAMGNYRKTSDIDFALKGDINLDIIAKVKYQLEEETTLPYFFDVVDYKNITDKELKKQIDMHGEVFYQKC
jgi:predicted nucleotidyltransferase